MTKPEWMLCYYLRARRFYGWKFRRQVLVELDGGQHSDRVRYDADRTRWLAGQGCRVIRYWNNEVWENTAGVLETLAATLKASVPSRRSPRPEWEP